MFLAVDPGGMIGYVLAENAPEPDLFTVVHWGEVKKTGHQAFLDKVYAEVEQHGITQIVVEAFRPTGGVKSWQPDALYQIGALKFIAGHFKITFAIQAVGDARDFATPEKEQPFLAQGVGKGGGGHARMALKHAIRWRWITYYGQHGQHN